MLDRACPMPNCNAAPGQPCMATRSGKRVALEAFHAQRLNWRNGTRDEKRAHLLSVARSMKPKGPAITSPTERT